MEYCAHCHKLVQTNRVVAGATEEIFCSECTGFIVSRRKELVGKEMAIGKLLKATSDVMKVTEAVRQDDEESVRNELVGTFLGLIEVSSDLGINLEGEITKRVKNKIRQEKHGKHCSL